MDRNVRFAAIHCILDNLSAKFLTTRNGCIENIDHHVGKKHWTNASYIQTRSRKWMYRCIEHSKGFVLPSSFANCWTNGTCRPFQRAWFTVWTHWSHTTCGGHAYTSCGHESWTGIIYWARCLVTDSTWYISWWQLWRRWLDRSWLIINVPITPNCCISEPASVVGLEPWGFYVWLDTHVSIRLCFEKLLYAISPTNWNHQTAYKFSSPLPPGVRVLDMGVSKNSGFSLQIIHFNRGFHYKPSILGYLYFWKHPYEGVVNSPKEPLCLDLKKLGCKSRGRTTPAGFIQGGWPCIPPSTLFSWSLCVSFNGKIPTFEWLGGPLFVMLFVCIHCS